MRKNRHFLLMQGPASPFFSRVGVALRQKNVAVTRMLFCPGDHLYWSKKSGKKIVFREKRHEFKAFINAQITEYGFTDILCLGDGRFWHRATIEICREMPDPPTVHIVEHGYYRPGYLTLEHDGIHANSNFCFGPELAVPEITSKTLIPPKFENSFLRYAAMDVLWNLTNVVFSPFFYRYFESHAQDHPFIEWFGWLTKALRAPLTRRQVNRKMENLTSIDAQKFLFPLQLATDYQIRQHGPSGGLIKAVEKVINSFARAADPKAVLVLKLHPLDNLRINWPKIIRATAQKQGILKRLLFLPAGDLDKILEQSAGCVTVNSTVGLQAIDIGVPTHVLGRALYDIKGLTHQGSLDQFWHTPSAPDADLAARFKHQIIAKTQLHGAFDGSGAPIGAENVAAKMLKG